MIHPGAKIHSTAILEDGISIGAGSSVWDNVHIRKNTLIGENCIIGEKTYIAYDVRIGNGVKINSQVYICTRVSIEDGVMISAGTIFTNDRFPRAFDPDGVSLKTSDPTEETLETKVRRGVTIGAGCTIGPGIELGEYCMVGMGSVVTRNVPPHQLVYGNPAKPQGYVCICGEPLSPQYSCPKCQREYELEGESIKLRPQNLQPLASNLQRLIMVASNLKRSDPPTSSLEPRASCLVPRASDLRPPTSNLQPRIGIVGGGLLGMTLALRLREWGFQVTLIEGTSRLGGLASSRQIGDYTWDRFYHVALLSDSNLLALLDSIGLKDKIKWADTKTGFYQEGKLYSVSNLLEFLKFPPLTLIDKFRLGWTLLYASKIRNWRRLEEVLVTDWLKRHSGHQTFEKVWLPLLKSKLGEGYRETSASFIWASISRMYSARRSGAKRETFGYVDGGFGTAISRLQNLLEKKGVEIFCRIPVSKVENANNAIILQTANDKVLHFDKVILTIPCQQITKICPQLAEREKKRLNDVVYQSLLCAILLIKNPLKGYYITNITDEWIPFTGVIEMTALVNKSYFNGNSLIYLPRYLMQEDSFYKKKDDEIKEIFLSALKRIYPIFNDDDLLAVNIERVDDFPTVPTLNYSQELLPLSKTSLPNVLLVNSAQISNGTITLNEIVGLANRKAAEIRHFILNQ